ncbi:hypothetical protein ACJX0J_012886, partial [Zea mays]
ITTILAATPSHFALMRGTFGSMEDIKRIADLEYTLATQVLRLEKKLDEVSENFEVEKEKCEIAETEQNRNMFAKIGAFLNEQIFFLKIQNEEEVISNSEPLLFASKKHYNKTL